MDRKELFFKIENVLLNEEKPSIFLNELKENGSLDIEPFNRLIMLENIQQSPKHHPEGNVWIHTMMVVDNGVKYRNCVNNKKVYVWALLLHDLGKIKTTKMRKGRWTSYDHDKVGEEEARTFLEKIINDKEYINKVSKLVRYHMHLLFLVNKLPYGDEKGLVKNVDLNDISYVFLADRLGRGGVDKAEEEKVKEDVEWFRKKYIL